MGNLEPNSRLSRAIVRAGTRTLRHIRRYWPFMTIRPCSPSQANRAPRSHSRAQCRRLGARVLPPTALEINRGDILDWPVSSNLAEDTLGNGAGVGVGIGEVAAVRGAPDSGGGDVAVAEDASSVEGDGEGGEGEGLHFIC